jgi:hypothetical protein
MQATADLVPLAGRYAELFAQAAAFQAMLDAGGAPLYPVAKDVLVLSRRSSSWLAAPRYWRRKPSFSVDRAERPSDRSICTRF